MTKKIKKVAEDRFGATHEPISRKEFLETLIKFTELARNSTGPHSPDVFKSQHERLLKELKNLK